MAKSVEREEKSGGKQYHKPSFEVYGNARDLTRMNIGIGADGNMGIDGEQLDPGTAS